MEQLQNGSGNPIAEMYQINSSAGLAVNYYKLFEKTHKGVVVQFEWKESVPLVGSSAPANLDVKYELGNTVYFIESKFLEPYCSANKRNSESYFETDRYPFPDHRDDWKELLEKESDFIHYDYAQLCRHLMAIYRHWLEHPEIYMGKTLVLQSVCWKMTDLFIKHYQSMWNDEDDLEARISALEEEKRKAYDYFNQHVKQIGWDACRFECKNYNDEDMLNAICKSKHFEQFKRQYFMEDCV